MSDAFVVIGKIMGERGKLFVDLTTLGYAFAMLVILAFKDIRDEFFPKKIRFFEANSFMVRILSYVFVAIMIVAVGVLDGGQFIYFQF